MRSSTENNENIKQIKNNHRNLYRVITIVGIGVFACIIGILGLLLGLFGAIKQIQNQYNEYLHNQWETTCLVLQYSCFPHPCYSCTDSHCNKSVCYDEKIEVRYSIFNGTEILSTIIFKNNPIQHHIQLGHTYRCYYDRIINFKTVQLEYIHSKSQTSIIISGCVLIIVAFIIFIILSIYTLFVERPRVKQMRRRSQMLQNLSSEHKDEI
ncbi:unnamed protein product [Rotaria sp. Silwood1]|nr:unnamed protein product [Rotaria sp. Silwood1]